MMTDVGALILAGGMGREKAGEIAQDLSRVLGFPSPWRIHAEFRWLGEGCDPGPALEPLLARTAPRILFVILDPAGAAEAGAWVRPIQARWPGVPMIAVMDPAETDQVYAVLNLGMADFLTPPFKVPEILPRVGKLLPGPDGSDPMLAKLREHAGLERLIGEHPVFLREIRKIPVVANSDSSVLISGETGTGKELCARAVHSLSVRAAAPFVAVNCGAIPLELAENELFGHEKEAFTGAESARPGLLSEAQGGTLFLDEIDSLPGQAQVKLLRVLQEREYRPLGSSRIRKADVRIVAASNLDPADLASGQRLRRDLFYRLNVVSLRLPPLRERIEDIPLLVKHFLARYRQRFGRNVLGFSAAAMRALLAHDWPGNIRELEHAVERMVVLCPDAYVQSVEMGFPSDPAPSLEAFQAAKARVIEEFEKRYVKCLLIAHKGNVSHAAVSAQQDRRAFFRLIQKHRINLGSYRL
jgi:DNA-binding NtrC family response regulator